jgi:hypothetical protein
MRPENPPAVATWILEHLTFGGKNDSLAGDLLEEFRRGRPASWYWRQVWVATARGIIKEVSNHWLAIVFAALWTVPQAAFVVYFAVPAVEKLLPFTAHIEWLNSAVCVLLVWKGLEVAFPWAGLILYILLHSLMTPSHNFRTIVRSLWISPLVYVAASAGELALQLALHNLTLVILGAYMIWRLPAFLSVLIGLWVALPGSEKRPPRIAA